MSTTAPPVSPAPPARPVSSHPTTLALAPHALAALVIVGVIVLLALGKINAEAGLALLGVAAGAPLNLPNTGQR